MSDVVDTRSVHTERRAQLSAFLKSRHAKITRVMWAYHRARVGARPVCAAKKWRTRRG
ncbi:hypothetical protein [Nocardia sp. NBC_00416]|uniref:hypothetical protein n=1 Tax=Nocardia sp. NBC_00416 TaxID=2975991 RepID=UPI002E208DF7